MRGFNHGRRFIPARIPNLLSAPRLLSFLALASLVLFCGCAKLHGWFAPDGPLPPKAPCVTLSWTAVESTVAGYHVYRSSGASKPVNLTGSPFYGTQFMDTTVESGQSYTYYVTAVSYKDVESRPSEKITVTVPAAVVPPPAAK